MKTTEYIVEGHYRTKMDKLRHFFVRMNAESIDTVLAETERKIKTDGRKQHDYGYTVTYAGPSAEYGN